jgi:hypothetical protein
MSVTHDYSDADAIAERIVARRPLFKDDALSGDEIDRLVDEEEADYAALAAIPRARDAKARAFRAGLSWTLHREHPYSEMTRSEHALLVQLIEGDGEVAGTAAVSLTDM